MKILFLIRSLANGGAERQLSLTAAGLQRIGYNVVVLTYYSEQNISNNINYLRLIEQGVMVKSINKNGRYDILGFLFRFIKVVRAEKPDIIYSFLELSNIIACLGKISNNKIKLVWGKRSSDLELERYRLSIRLEHTIEKVLSFFSDLIITNSEQGKQYLMKREYKSSICVVYNGFDLINNGIAKDKAFLESLYPAILNQTLIGAVGRVDYAKDYETLLKAFALVAKQYDSVILLIVGRVVQSEYYQILSNLVKLNRLESKVIFVPEIDAINKFYKSIDIFVSSSYTEGFSNVIAEAMLAGLPCVVTDAGDNVTLIGDSGVVVERRNYVALSNGILAMLGNKELRDCYGTLGKKRIADKFNLNNLIKNTEYYLKSLYEN